MPVNLVFNQAIGLTQAGQSVTKTIAQTTVSTVSAIASTVTGTGANILHADGRQHHDGIGGGHDHQRGRHSVGGHHRVHRQCPRHCDDERQCHGRQSQPWACEFVQLANTSSTMAGVGTTILSGTNAYTGNTYIEGGVLRLESQQAIPGGIGATTIAGTTSSAIILDGGQIGLDGSVGGTNTATTTNGGSFLHPRPGHRGQPGPVSGQRWFRGLRHRCDCEPRWNGRSHAFDLGKHHWLSE